MKKIVELMDYSINKFNNLIKKNDMKLHEITEIHEKPYFRKMRVESGFMYDFWNSEKDDYNDDWTFVPDASERVRSLEHHQATTVGLWATDRPDLIDDPKKLLFEITG